jgi:hypothetical protein
VRYETTPLPRLLYQIGSATCKLKHGQTLVLSHLPTTITDLDGKSFGNSAKAHKTLLVFIGPTSINPAGGLVHSGIIY